MYIDTFKKCQSIQEFGPEREGISLLKLVSAPRQLPKHEKCCQQNQTVANNVCSTHKNGCFKIFFKFYDL